MRKKEALVYEKSAYVKCLCPNRARGATTVRLAANFAAYCIKRECTLAMLIKCGDLSAGRPKHGLPQISFARKQKIG
jgi:hypothetical protein